MSGISKTFLVLALIGSLVAAWFGYKLVEQKNELVAKYDEEQGAHKKTKADLEKTQKELADEKKVVEETKGKLADSDKKGSALQSSLSEAVAKVSDLEKSIKDLNAKAESEQKKLKELEALLGGDSPQGLRDKLKKVEGDKQQQMADKKKLEDELAASKAEMTRLNDMKIRAQTGDMPPGISGKILTVNKTWNFIVLSIGDKEGVVENGVFVVYRGKEFIGKVKVVSTDAHTCVADILPDMTKGAIQVGDEVFN